MSEKFLVNAFAGKSYFYEFFRTPTPAGDTFAIYRNGKPYGGSFKTMDEAVAKVRSDENLPAARVVNRPPGVNVNLRYIYAAIAFVGMSSGLFFAIREFSWWSFLIITGALVGTLVLQAIVGFVMGDPSLRAPKK